MLRLMLRQRSGSDMVMSPHELRRNIMALEAKPPITIAFERALVRQGTRSEEGEGYVRIALVENEQRLRQAARNVRRYLQSMGVNSTAA